MAVRREGNDLVIDGFEQGLADAPEKGIAFMRNVNLVSIPGEASVNYAMSAVNTIPAVDTGLSCTFAASTDIVTFVGAPTLYTGMSVTFGSTTGGVTAGTLYWITALSSTTGKLYTNIFRNQLVDLTSNVSNTYSLTPMGRLVQKTLDFYNKNEFFLDDNGRAWWVNSSGNLTYLGNTTLTSAHGNGMCVLGKYLFVFRDSAMDYFLLTDLTSTSAPTWVYGWNSYSLTSDSSTGYSHYAINAQDNGMYFCNGQTIQSVLVIGNTIFDPSQAPPAASYTASMDTTAGYALVLPTVDRATCLAELGTNILVGGIQNKVYPWDRVSTSYNYPLILGESYTTRMVTTNSSTYVFAGNRGRIYVTNGANVMLFKKIPDHIVQIFGSTNGLDPYFTWKDAIYWKNQIYFSFEAAKNDGTVITNMGGLWAIDVSMNIMMTPTAVALRMVNTMSGGSALVPSVIAPNIRTNTPGGSGVYAGWYSTVITGYGLDVTTSTPYTNSGIGGEIYTDLIPVGTFIAPTTFTEVEFKFAKPMVSGESIRISARQSNSDSWTVLGTTSTTVLSNIESMGTENAQWMQFYVELFSTASSPSLLPLTQIRLR